MDQPTRMPIERVFFIALGGAAVLWTAPACASCQRGATTYDMPAQRLDSAVQQLARRSGCPVTVDPVLLGDRRAPAVRGSYKPEAALARLIRNTGYTARSTSTGLAFDGSVLDITMSQARVLRTALQTRARARTIAPGKAVRLRALLTAVERDVPRQVNAQGMLTPAQRRDAIRKLDAVRDGVGAVADARDWAAFRRGAA